jgi:aspartyl-tRNA(Asn)/glutamyl-tRNA(Gln) amidotransferase subunit B
MPKLPEQARQELVQNFGLTEYDAEVLTLERASLDYFFEVLKISGNAKLSCNWLTSELFGLLNKNALSIENSPIKASDLGALVTLIDTEVLSGKLAKMVFEEMWANPGKSPGVIVDEKGLKQITDEKSIAATVEKVIGENPAQLAEFLSGKDRIVPFFIGKVMKETGGKANPGVVNKLVNEALNKKKINT